MDQHTGLEVLYRRHGRCPTLFLQRCSSMVRGERLAGRDLATSRDLAISRTVPCTMGLLPLLPASHLAPSRAPTAAAPPCNQSAPAPVLRMEREGCSRNGTKKYVVTLRQHTALGSAGYRAQIQQAPKVRLPEILWGRYHSGPKYIRNACVSR